jgi:hypothetical protein
LFDHWEDVGFFCNAYHINGTILRQFHKKEFVCGGNFASRDFFSAIIWERNNFISGKQIQPLNWETEFNITRSTPYGFFFSIDMVRHLHEEHARENRIVFMFLCVCAFLCQFRFETILSDGTTTHTTDPSDSAPPFETHIHGRTFTHSKLTLNFENHDDSAKLKISLRLTIHTTITQDYYTHMFLELS